MSAFSGLFTVSPIQFQVDCLLLLRVERPDGSERCVRTPSGTAVGLPPAALVGARLLPRSCLRLGSCCCCRRYHHLIAHSHGCSCCCSCGLPTDGGAEGGSAAPPPLTSCLSIQHSTRERRLLARLPPPSHRIWYSHFSISGARVFIISFLLLDAPTILFLSPEFPALFRRLTRFFFCLSSLLARNVCISSWVGLG